AMHADGGELIRRNGVMEWWSIDCNSLRLSHRHSTTPSLRTLQSIRQERGIGGFEMDVLRQFRRLEAQDEDVCARPELSAGFRSGIGRFAIYPNDRARGIGKFETERPGVRHLKFGAEENPYQPGVLIQLHRGLNIFAQQSTVHE